MTDYFGKQISSVASRKTLQALPEAQTGYALDTQDASFWSILVGEERTNLILNPSFEEATTNWTIVASSSSSSGERASQGYKCLKATEGGSNFSAECDWTAAAAGAYVLSVDLAAPIDTTFSLGVSSLSKSKEFRIIDPGWNRYWFQVYVASAGTYEFTVTSTDTALSGRVFYLDAAQVEAGAYPTTYIDGSLVGFGLDRTLSEYWWNGEPHNSTSTRTALTRHGGKEVFLDEMGFATVSIQGFSAPVYQPNTRPLARGGVAYDGTREEDRQLSIAGQFMDCDFQTLSRHKADLIDLIKPNQTDQPIVLRFNATRGLSGRYGRVMELWALYTGGLEGSITNYNIEAVNITFQQLSRNFYSIHGDVKTSLSLAESINPNPAVFQRGRLGGWSGLGGGTTNGAVNGVLYLNGDIYAYGNFTQIGGVAADRFAYWNGTTWAEVGTGLNNEVTHAVLGNGPYEGSIILTGDFTADGAGAGTLRRFIEWNGATFVELGSGLNNHCTQLASYPNGDIYWAGPATADNAASTTFSGCGFWDASGTAWDDMASGLDSDANSCVLGPDGRIYFFGLFSTDNFGAGLDLDEAAAWNPFWVGIASVAGAIKFEAIGGNGTGTILWDGYWNRSGNTLFVTEFTAGELWRWTGAGFIQIAPPDLGPDGAGAMMGELPNGMLYMNEVIQDYIQIGQTTDTVFRFIPDGAHYVGSDIITDQSFSLGNRMSVLLPDHSFVVGWDESAATVEAASTTTVTNLGDERAGPVIRLTGPGFLYELINYTNGAALYFSLEMPAGEEIEIDLTRRGNPVFRSNMRSAGGVVSAIVLPGSSLEDFVLEPGENEISVFMVNTDGNSAVDVRWQDTYPSIEHGL